MCKSDYKQSSTHFLFHASKACFQNYFLNHNFKTFSVYPEYYLMACLMNDGGKLMIVSELNLAVYAVMTCRRIDSIFQESTQLLYVGRYIVANTNIPRRIEK